MCTGFRTLHLSAVTRGRIPLARGVAMLSSSWPPLLYRSTEVLLHGQANTNAAIAFDAAADCATGVPSA